MINDDKLSTVLSEFARTLTTDFPIQSILDHLVERIVEVLPITSAGVTLIAPGAAPRYVAASDPSALRYEQLQTEFGEGPCLLAHRSRNAVTSAKLADDTRFPAFAPAASAAGLAAVFAFPLRHGAGCLGALDLYREKSGALDPNDMTAAQTLADVAAAYLLNAYARDEARLASDRFHHDALHDALTGLPNRLLLHERLEHASQRSRRALSRTAALFVDIDGFKQVNDLNGHHVGDALLVAIAHRLGTLTRAGDTLARYAGDEFVFICEDLSESADVEGLEARIQHAFAEPFAIDGRQLAVTASIGSACTVPGGEVTSQLLIDADLAMFSMKRRRAEALPRTTTRVVRSPLEIELRAALGAGTLSVHYQPIVDVATERPTGVEALVCWHHPVHGQVPPSTITAIAEQSELLDDLSRWVVGRACTDHVSWRPRPGGTAIDLSINISPPQLADSSFVRSANDIIAASGMDTSRLIVELTESPMIVSNAPTMAAIRSWTGSGVRLALDDFGSGYSSLHYLDRLPIAIIKIDQHFIARLTHPGSDVTIISGIATIAHQFGIEVVAGGVETRIQLDLIRSAGCEFAQGYFFARPMSASAIEEILENRQVLTPIHTQHSMFPDEA